MSRPAKSTGAWTSASTNFQTHGNGDAFLRSRPRRRQGRLPATRRDAIVNRGLEPMEEIAATRTAKNDVRDPIFSRKSDQGTGHIVMFREMTKPPIFCAVSKVSAI